MDTKIINLLKNGLKGPTLSKFLTLDEQRQLTNNDLEIIFSNNYQDEERKRAFLFPKGYDLEADFKISFLKVLSKMKLKHSDILGALMSLGITREVIGDILIGDEVIIICASEIEKYLLENLSSIGANKIELQKVANITSISPNQYLKLAIIVSSLRLDNILSKGLNLSREKAQTLIKLRNVKINGAICIDNDYFCRSNDLISITKFGRIIVRDIARTTKKEKIVLNIEKTQS